ncbi:MAG: hypothetical protein HRU19_01420 [Pseudobacteriovorax sp.]|nr:hypothetical protein [Pseudobacteriovorax sp.]
MLHQADLQWLEELRTNLACYLEYSSAHEKERVDGPHGFCTNIHDLEEIEI